MENSSVDYLRYSSVRPSAYDVRTGQKAAEEFVSGILSKNNTIDKGIIVDDFLFKYFVGELKVKIPQKENFQIHKLYDDVFALKKSTFFFLTKYLPYQKGARGFAIGLTRISSEDEDNKYVIAFFPLCKIKKNEEEGYHNNLRELISHNGTQFADDNILPLRPKDFIFKKSDLERHMVSFHNPKLQS